MANPYERAKRLEKVLKLTAAIDKIGARCKAEVLTARFVASVQDMSADWWKALAEVAGCKPPSERTIVETLMQLQDRLPETELQALAKKNGVPFLGRAANPAAPVVH